MVTFLLALIVACTPSLQTEDIATYDTQTQEPLTIGIYTDGVCGHAIGDDICDLVLKDQNDDMWRLHDVEGDIVVLDFSAMWCGPCQSAASTVQEMQDFYESEGFHYITILIDDPTGDTVELDEAQDWADAFGIETAPVLQGSRDLVNVSPELGYPISSWPTFVFVDRNLEIFWGIYGYSEEYLKMVIEDML
jgi:thiol-disulfide isomerase/thioredoxin|tara:strand:+ start:268 stop:843 length:576 start_codon:yes stop_codon:yes gene_type:complete